MEEFISELSTQFRKYQLPRDKNSNCGKSAPQKEGGVNSIRVFDFKISLEVESSTLSDIIKHVSWGLTWWKFYFSFVQKTN